VSLTSRWKDKCGVKRFWQIKNKNPTPPWRTATQTVRNSSILLTTSQQTMITIATITPTLLTTCPNTLYVTTSPLHRFYLALHRTLLTSTTLLEKRSETLPLHHLHYLKHNKGWAEVVHTHDMFLTFIGRSVCVDARSARHLCDR